MNALGQHLLIDLYGCDPAVLDDVERVRDLMVGAATQLGATIVAEFHHKFQPYGVSVVVVIAESHLSVHTWPEYRYAAVDVFTCSQDLSPSDVLEFIVSGFRAEAVTTMEVKRGLLVARPAVPPLTETARAH